VTVAEIAAALGDPRCGYELLAPGGLDGFLDGRARKITVASIHAFIARKLTAAGATGATAQRSTSETASRR